MFVWENRDVFAGLVPGSKSYKALAHGLLSPFLLAGVGENE